MPDKFCSQCGAELLADARFCMQCGRALKGGRVPAARPAFHLGRWAPAVVFGGVVLIGSVAVLFALYKPAVAPSVPGRAAPDSAPSGGAMNGGAMPPGHPPLEIPEDVKKTLADLRQQAEAAPDDLEAWNRLAGAEYRAGQLDRSYLSKAEQAYLHILQKTPKDLEALRTLGNIAFDRDQSEQAIDYYKRYLAVKPDDINVKTDMATMYLAKGEAETAIGMYQKVLAEKPGFFQPLFNLGIAYKASGDAEKSKEYFEQAKKAAPDDRARAQVDEVMARAFGTPAAPGSEVEQMAEQQGAAPAQVPAPAAGGNAFEQSVEAIFRNHPMLSPKLDHFAWSDGDAKVKVFLHDFPMGAMPDAIRERFADHIRTELTQSKQAAGKTTPVTVELVDAGTQSVMDTVTQ